MKMDELREMYHIWVKPDMPRQLCLAVSVEELMDLGFDQRHVLNLFV